MVTVKNYALREGEKGTFVSLELVGDLEMVQSSNTGRFYATVRRCFVSSTLDEETAKQMVGKNIKGSISRVEVEEYEYTVPETAEVILLKHRWDYTPEEGNVVALPRTQAA